MNSAMPFTLLPPHVAAFADELARARSRPPRLVETHISWLLLDGDCAWKIKKPLKLDFIDAAEPARRHWLCDEEVRLNRRLAPGLYVGVVALRDAAGAVVDHAVQMRQFPPGALASELLAAGRLDAAMLASLAETLADFHRAAPQLSPDDARVPADPAAIGATALRVVDQLVALEANATGMSADAASSASAAMPTARHLATLRDWLATEAAPLAPFWSARRAAGWTRDCHGDLHLANLVLLDGRLTAFDCIDFDPTLRCIDVQADIAFPVMDLLAHGRRDLAFGLLDGWLQSLGDFAGLATLRFQLVERALVRALVGRLTPGRAAATPDDASGAASDASDASPPRPDYLALAADLAAAPAPRLLITHGLSGSGKSRLALDLLRHAGAIRLRSDVERKRLFGLAPRARSHADEALARAGGIYTPEATRATFDRLFAHAAATLDAGWPVIVDAAFFRHDERARFRNLARQRGVPFAILDCSADPALLRARIAARAAAGDDPSEADLAVLDAQLRQREPLAADEAGCAISVDTGAPIDIAAIDARWAAASAD